MDSPFTRRDALKGMISTGAAAWIKPSSTLIHTSAIQVSSLPVEVTLTSISAQTVRVTVQPAEKGEELPLPEDGALSKDQWGRAVARVRAIDGSRTIQCGDLRVTLSDRPLTIRVERMGGGLVQELTLDGTSSELRLL